MLLPHPRGLVLRSGGVRSAAKCGFGSSAAEAKQEGVRDDTEQDAVVAAARLFIESNILSGSGVSAKLVVAWAEKRRESEVEGPS